MFRVNAGVSLIDQFRQGQLQKPQKLWLLVSFLRCAT